MPARSGLLVTASSHCSSDRIPKNRNKSGQARIGPGVAKQKDLFRSGLEQIIDMGGLGGEPVLLIFQYFCGERVFRHELPSVGRR